jgi:hypothetical protein
VNSHIAISGFLLYCFFDIQHAILETPTLTGINGPDQRLIRRLRFHRDFAYCDYARFSLHFKDRAGSPRSNGGRILCSDLTPEIYPPLQRALFLFLFRSDGPHAVGNFGWDPTISDASPPSLHILLTWKNFNSALIPPEPTLFLFVHRCTF